MANQLLSRQSVRSISIRYIYLSIFEHRSWSLGNIPDHTPMVNEEHTHDTYSTFAGVTEGLLTRGVRGTLINVSVRSIRDLLAMEKCLNGETLPPFPPSSLSDVGALRPNIAASSHSPHAGTSLPAFMRQHIGEWGVFRPVYFGSLASSDLVVASASGCSL